MEVQLAQLPQQLCQLVLAIQVRAIAGDVLSNDQQLLHPGGGQLGGLIQQFVHGTAAVLAPQGGNDAVGTVVVTALGDAQIGIPWRRGQDALAALVGSVNVADVAGPQSLLHNLHNGPGNITVAAGSQDAIHLRQLLQHVVLIPLCHAASDQNFLDLARFFQLGHLQNVVNGLLTGGGQKAAGIDHHHVAAFGGCLNVIARSLTGCHHLLAVHLVLGTAQGDK